MRAANTPSPSDHRWTVQLALALACLLLIAHAAVMRGFWADDAFISYRYARNIATGLGAVFNPGERVEGYSNPLFTFLLAGVYRIVHGPTTFPAVARGIGVVSAFAALFALTLCPGAELRRGIALAVLLTAVSTSFALWAIGGLETSLYGLLITLGFALTLRRPSGALASAGMGVVLALIVLSRPEGVLPAAALFLGRFLDSETRRDLKGHAIVALCAAAPVLAYVGWRVSYFGNLLPNTYYTKHFPPAVAFPRGFWYVKDFFDRNGSLPVYAPIVFAFRSPATRRVAWLGGLILASDLAFVLIAGGDWMFAHRFIAPVTPILYLLTALGWIELLDLVADGLRARGSAARGAVPVGAAFAWLLLALPNAHLTNIERDEPTMSVIPYFTTMSKVIGTAAPHDWTIATHDIGAVGWYGQTKVLDMIGLVDPWVRGRLLAGDSAVAVRRPELVLLHYDNRTPPLGRWLPIRVAGMDSAYVVPKGVENLPRSLRVRVDLAPEFERRLAAVPPDLRRDVKALYQHLLNHQPDMYPVLVTETP